MRYRRFDMTSTESAAPLLTREMARNLSVHDSRAWKLLFPAERAAIAAIADGRVVCVPAAQAAVSEAGALSCDEIVAALKNIGYPVECGACMEAFYTGMSMAKHDCSGWGRSRPPVKCLTCYDWGIIGGMVPCGDGDVDHWEEPCPDCSAPARQERSGEAGSATLPSSSVAGAQAAVPEGFVLVPKVATPEMLRELRALCSAPECPPTYEVYSAMLAAAPAPSVKP